MILAILDQTEIFLDTMDFGHLGHDGIWAVWNEKFSQFVPEPFFVLSYGSRDLFTKRDEGSFPMCLKLFSDLSDEFLIFGQIWALAHGPKALGPWAQGPSPF